MQTRLVRLLTRRVSATCFATVALAMLYAISAAAQNTVESKSVLILFTHQSDQPGQAMVENAMRSALQTKSPVNLEIYSEYLDAVRTPLDDFENDLIKQYQHKYSSKKFDLIFAVNPPALHFLLKNRSALAPDAPVVFLVLDQSNVSGLDTASNVTGVWGEVNYATNLELAFSLHPGTEQVVVVSGVGDWDNYWRSVVQEQLRPFAGRVAISYLTGLTIPEQKEALSGLPPHTIVLFVSSTRDKEGNNPGNLEVLRQICPASNAPIYGNSDGQLGLGIVGGHLLSFEALGIAGAQTGARILAGEKPETIVPHGIPTVPMFDWRELQRWGIKEENLPAGSVVQYKQLSDWEQYKWYVIGFSVLLTLETLLIALLIYLRLRRRQAEAEAVRLNSRIGEIVANVPGIVWESRNDSATGGRRTTFISDYVQSLLGYTAKEWLEHPPGFGFELVAEEDRKRVKAESEAVMQTGQEGVSEFRWVRSDGGMRWVENHLSPIRLNGNVVGLRGVALDITDRKLAEEHAREAEERDKAILSAIPDLMFLQSRDGVYLDYHATDRKDLLVPPETFLGKNISEVLPPELAELFINAFNRAEEGGDPQVLEYKVTLAGEERWFEARMVRTGDNIISIVRDITDRIRALESLLRSEERFSKAFRSSPQPMSITTIADGRYVDVNDSFLAMSGYTRNEVIGRSSLELGIWETPGIRAAFIRSFLENGTTSNVETRFVTKDGSVRTLLSSAERIEIGGEDCILIGSSDITERIKDQEALRKSEARLAADLADAKHLHKISSLLLREEDVGALYEQILNAVIQLLDSDAGSMQVLDETKNELKLLAHKGFDKRSAAFWQRVRLDSDSACAEALRRGERVIVPSVEVCEFLAGTDDLAEFERSSLRSVQSTPLVSRTGRVVGMISTLWNEPHEPSERELRLVDVVARQAADLLERNMAREELRQSERRLRLAQHAARVGTWEWDIETGASVWSEMIWELLGVEPGDGDVTVERFLSFIHPEDREHVWNNVNNILADGEEYYDEFRLLRRNGRIVWVVSQGRVIRASNGQPERMLGVNIDITERKLAEQAVRDSESRFRNMAENAPVMIWMTDENQATTYVNKQWLELTGSTMAQESGLDWSKHLHPDDLTPTLDGYTHAFEERIAFDLEFRVQRVDGEYRWVFTSGTPRFSSEGQFLGYIGTAIDITERKESERELQQAHDELNALKNQLEAENIYLQEELQQDQAFGDIVGQSAAIKYVLFKVSQVAPLDSTVLITGETGTGKELVARAIHEGSKRKDRPLIKVNCAALTPTLIESELFGHEKGSFTGAAGRKIGRFELANRGTLLLDEIGELPLDLQAKLLRVLQEGEFERVGSGITIKTDVRVIALTNRDLKQEVEKGKFREDLWYRLNVFPITTPPLRERRDDIPLLTDHFTTLFSRKFGKGINAVAPDSMKALSDYSWPGNVRELANIIERAVINARGRVLRISEDFSVLKTSAVAAGVKTLEEIERDHIIVVLQDTQWRIDGQRGAALLLGINPSTLRTRMAKLGISKPKTNGKPVNS